MTAKVAKRRKILLATSASALTFLLCELVQQTGFADTHVANYDVLKYVIIVIWTSGHLEYWNETQRREK